MGQFDEIKISSFEPGLITDPDSLDIPIGGALVAQNVDLTSPGKMKKSRGPKTFGLPSLPSGFVEDSFCEFHITVPEAKNITVRSGIQSSRRKFLASPWYDDLTQTWNTTTYLELTETILTTIATKSSNNERG